MYWTLELASKLEDAPWPATREELIDYAIDLGVENGFIQEGETAEESFIPEFKGEGVKN